MMTVLVHSFSFILSRGDVPTYYGISTSLTMGSKSSTILAGHAATDWFSVSSSKDSTVPGIKNLAGKKAELSVSGTLALKGTVDVKFTLYDKSGDVVSSFSKIDVKASGGQLSSTKIRGILRIMPQKQLENKEAG
jgi:hypothetical protein